MASDADLITRSFELAAERCDDLTPLVYDRLFAAQPEMERLFWRDRETHSVRGEMLAKVIEAILDFVGPRAYARALIQCEVITHEGYDVPRDVFVTFFGTVAESLRELLGADWTAETDTAWARTLKALSFYVENPDQFTAPENIGRESQPV